MINDIDFECLKDLDVRLNLKCFSLKCFSWQHLDYLVLKDTLHELLEVYDNKQRAPRYDKPK